MVAKSRQEIGQLAAEKPRENDEVALVKDQGEREAALKEWTAGQL